MIENNNKLIGEFLFPTSLLSNDKKPNRILAVGSCLTETYVIHWRKKNIISDVIFRLFNNVEIISEEDKNIESDLRFIQIPLRSVLGDITVRHEYNQSIDKALDFIETVKSRLDHMIACAMQVGEKKSSITLISNFIIPQGFLSPSLSEIGTPVDLRFIISELNNHLASYCAVKVDTYIADIEMLSQSFGKMNFLDDFIYFSYHGSLYYSDWPAHERAPAWAGLEPGRIEEIPDMNMQYTCRNIEFLDGVYDLIIHYYRVSIQLEQVKIVIFDLDNTMWRGSIAQHYDNIEIKPYSDGWPLGIWELVHILKSRGILTAVCSKNDLHVVQKLWHLAVDPPFVSLEDFDFIEIGWDEKIYGIQRILDASNLTSMSCVFVDDNPIERTKVVGSFQGIRVIGSNPFEIKRILQWSSSFQITGRSNETLNRSDLIKDVEKRKIAENNLDRASFLQGLEVKVCCMDINYTSKDFGRVFELLNKTNQFNTNGIRWSIGELKGFFATGGYLYAFSAKDNFSNYGIILACLVNGTEIVQLVMSCRVIGLDIEIAALSYVVEKIREFYGFPCEVIASITETERNSPTRDIFTRSSFDLSDNSHFFQLSIDKTISVPSHIQIEINSH
jgi:FkbH-like protein